MFCINIGDSNMMIFDPITGKALKVWKRPQKDDMYNVCSYDDTLASYPDYLHEGQSLFAVRQDYNFVGEYCKQFATLKGRCFYSLTSPSSIYGLSLINTLGNRNHDGRTLSRTSVYEFDIQTLLDKTEGKRFSIICVTDGIKDVLDSTDIGSFHLNFQEGINQKYEKIRVEVENERKRKEIYRKYELEFGAEPVKSKSTNSLGDVLVIENTLDEMPVDDEIINEMNLNDVKNNLKNIVYGYNKERPLDIYDVSSLNIILRHFKQNKINSFKTSDYYNSIISSSSSSSNTSDSEMYDDNSQSQTTTESSIKSYYPEFLTCLTNFAALCQTLDDCTAINMEISSIDPNRFHNENEGENSNCTSMSTSRSNSENDMV